MGLKITELGVTVPGKITRKYDEAANQTTLVLTEAQVEALGDSVALAQAMFSQQRTQDSWPAPRAIKDQPQA